jgi:calcium/calmodulin-dependent protein kinase (CaM kinase) II
MSPALEPQLLELTRQLLNAIADRDWKRYSQLCDPSMTCFEPEALGQLVEGMEFHKFYFDLHGATSKQNTTLTSPHVRLIGQDAAVVSYVRLIQKVDSTSGDPVSASFDETRVWQRIQGEWKHVHFHRSAASH